MNPPQSLSAWIFCFVLLFGCHYQTSTPPQELTKAEFERQYSAWHEECETIKFSSNTYDYIGLPSYRKIVGLGTPALTFLEEKMEGDKGLDFMLAFAVVEICGWDREEFRGGSEQEFRDRVLRKLRQK